jgi:hypothetical protein
MPFGLGAALGVTGSEVLIRGLAGGAEAGFLDGDGGGMEDDGNAFCFDSPCLFVPFVVSVGTGAVVSFAFATPAPFVTAGSWSSFSTSSDTVAPFAATGCSFAFFSFFFRFLI